MFNKSNALKSARGNMAFVMVFTVVNIALLILDIGVNFPFSLFSPFLTGIWAFLSFTEGDTFGIILYLAVFVLTMGSFLISWLLSLNKPKALILGFVIYLADTAFMIWFYLSLGDNTWMLDALFHLWVLISMGFAIYVSFTTPKAEVNPFGQDNPDNYERL